MSQPLDKIALESARDPKIVKIVTPSLPRDDEARKRRLAEGRAKAHARKKKKRYKRRPRPQPPPLRDDGPDQLVPDPIVIAELGITRMTIWRWSHLPQYADLSFPKPVEVNGRNFRSRRQLEQWKRDRIALASDA